MSSLTTENALRQQLRQLRQQLPHVGESFTAADLRLLLVDSLQKLDAISPPEVNEGETKTSNIGSNAGGPQPQTNRELKEWIKEANSGVKNHGQPNTWDVTLVTDMSYLFEEMKNFNEPIDQWNTSEVTNMEEMFSNASSFNQPITMDTSQVTDMRGMFEGATAMTHPLPQTKEMIAVSNFFLKVLQIKIKSRFSRSNNFLFFFWN